MKLSELWLREWVDVPAPASEICQRLNLAGLEAEAVALLERIPQQVQVGRILACEPHPAAERLQVCQVDVGEAAPRQIVCGAPNARVGILVPTALPGAVLPDGKPIGEARLRGIASAGMLCSAAELGLSDKAEGLLELDSNARPGTALGEHLQLGDQIITLELTPNRGDCLSARGLAREVAALYQRPLAGPRWVPVPVTHDTSLPLRILAPDACSQYAGRIIRGIRSDARTPDWMRERLARSGIRCIHPLVDVTNYVMLELGQPMHAFDLRRLSGSIQVRRARPGERLLLLNGQTVDLQDEPVIADDVRVLALAGVMGGEPSAVSVDTSDVFLESAWFAPVAVAASGRRFQLNSDSLYRFERGVDVSGQRDALERASELILRLFGGAAGPISSAGEPAADIKVRLRPARISRVLGHRIDDEVAAEILQRLHMQIDREPDGWAVRIPPFRHDLRLEVDLIEEVGRLYGYENIPARAYTASLQAAPASEATRSLAAVREAFVSHGYLEAVTYSFVDPAVQRLLNAEPAIALDNPIAETMGEMRTTLWSGLLPTLRYNLLRQQDRVRLFEIGRCYWPGTPQPREQQNVAAVAAGSALPAQWGSSRRPLDLFDIKGDLHGIFALAEDALEYRLGGHPALHPGRSATIFRAGVACGVIGELHPRLVTALELPQVPYLFELAWNAISQRSIPVAEPVPEFPGARRDIAVVIPEATTAQQLRECARQAGGALLRDLYVFDIYRGPGLPDGFKSLALGLIFQDYSRTLTDKDVENAVGEIVAHLSAKLRATLRG